MVYAAPQSLFLEACHGPTYPRESCCSEFYAALDLVEEFSAKSYISRRLWHTIRVLKRLGPKLGVTPPTADEIEQVRTEAVSHESDLCPATIHRSFKIWNEHSMEIKIASNGLARVSFRHLLMK